MAEHFLTKCQIDLSQCLETGGGLALESHGALYQALRERVSPEAAALFAEPLLSRGNETAPASVAWYTEYPGEGRPLRALDEADRSRVEAVLSERLRAIRAHLADPEDGPLIGAALHLANHPDGDIWVVDGQPVIVNWGMLPVGMSRDPETRGAHVAATLGRFLPLAAAPPLSATEAMARRADVPTDTPPETDGSPSPAAGATVAPGPVPPEPAARAWPGAIAWVPLLALLLIAGGVLVWLLLPGTRIFPPRSPDPAIDRAAAAAAVAEINASLEDRLARLQAALDGAQCRPDGTLTMPDGRTIEGLLPPDLANPADAPGSRAAADPHPILPPDPARVQVPSDGASAMDLTSLLELIEARTVMVVRYLADADARPGEQVRAERGSGFFVGPDLVVTNNHVVAGAQDDRIFVINRSLGQQYPVTVIKTVGPFGSTGRDFALLRVQGVNAPYFTLLKPDHSLKLQSVIAAGYPDDLLGDWRGGTDPVPDLAVTDGTVNAEQVLAQGTPAIVHSAPISQGNSGGPLVDMCGRVVGVNTFVRQGALRNLNVALASGDLLDFLESAALTPATVTRPCQPQLLRPVAPPASAGTQAEAAAGVPDFNLRPSSNE
ncbi:trypsin-like peptidase domain-containing protein [Rhodovulum sulfidophilum]|uniref:Trypsin-like peptidase domain-containing protein n=2 Tax=Rhodovulum sulfidophilum TaxID=35806 RepID=A0ABS1S0U3_RHOSU|nr:trypsin-like peptidase domain-containing protein [Rhodovulum sulfidophilum]MBL3610955.1 trypsin-like peptidase domain-containing protein [Rhodovulum sulfidophilum]